MPFVFMEVTVPRLAAEFLGVSTFVGYKIQILEEQTI